MYDLKIFTENVEPEALNQIYTLVKQPAFCDCKVRVMPDVHAGAGCVIGFTADLGEKVIPNIVGVDIGCGMLTIELGKIEVDFEKLDSMIRQYIPSGFAVHNSRKVRFDDIKRLRCIDGLKNVDRFEQSIGTLGGGNHFIEVDTDEDGNKYLVIHTGSRNLGKQVADYYQKLAVEMMQGKDDLIAAQELLIKRYTAEGRKKEISKALAKLKREFKPRDLGIPRDLCYLVGADRDDYLHDMEICQRFAVLNRNAIGFIILNSMGWHSLDAFETIHNYIELESNMVRKGAISAKKGERLLIPINMRDGCILGVGKGNEDWNCSAPHGAGRIMSRSEAKRTLSLEEYEHTMDGIFTTSVGRTTIDEAPMAYKPMDEIVTNIADTVEVLKIIKPKFTCLNVDPKFCIKQPNRLPLRILFYRIAQRQHNLYFFNRLKTRNVIYGMIYDKFEFS